MLPIEDILNCSVEAVKFHVFKGRKRLKKILKEHL
jgi:DNA-directed RNA polymerase specialized sigma24 family protein